MWIKFVVVQQIFWQLLEPLKDGKPFFSALGRLRQASVATARVTHRNLWLWKVLKTTSSRNSLEVSFRVLPPLFTKCSLRHAALENLPFVMCQSALVCHWYLADLGDNTLRQVSIITPQTFLPPFQRRGSSNKHQLELEIQPFQEAEGKYKSS